MGRVAEERNWHDRAIGIDEEEGNEGYSRLFEVIDVRRARIGEKKERKNKIEIVVSDIYLDY